MTISTNWTVRTVPRRGGKDSLRSPSTTRRSNSSPDCVRCGPRTSERKPHDTGLNAGSPRYLVLTTKHRAVESNRTKSCRLTPVAIRTRQPAHASTIRASSVFFDVDSTLRIDVAKTDLTAVTAVNLRQWCT